MLVEGKPQEENIKCKLFADILNHDSQANQLMEKVEAIILSKRTN
jgi:hypothetical protein